MKTIRSIITAFAVLSTSVTSVAQNYYFIDGFHGGVYGHYPKQYTKFIVKELNSNPHWCINLEIEPETWDFVSIYDPKGLFDLQKMVSDGKRIEYVNPTYGQPYMYNIEGESIIRQLSYGMEKLKSYFPKMTFLTYSCEEPCFTSSLPTILTSFGFKYTSTKNPNTCWGGYFAPYGNGNIYWLSPDNVTKILTSPRYSVEELDTATTWRTSAHSLNEKYIKAVSDAGVVNPVGMCIQDAGWEGGPWLTSPMTKDEKMYSDTSGYKYALWRDYFSQYPKGVKVPTHKYSQEDIKPGLVWGSQVLQRVSQRVRHAENELLSSEKMAAMAKVLTGAEYPEKDMFEAWRGTLLSEHHDCWIVPYNGEEGNTWADKVNDWTDVTKYYCDKTVANAISSIGGNGKSLLVFNTMGTGRRAIAFTKLPSGFDNAVVTDACSKVTRSQITSDGNIMFMADVPAFGFARYDIKEGRKPDKTLNAEVYRKKNVVVIENDYYKIAIDPSKGGTISSLIMKKEHDQEIVKNHDGLYFNGLRGYYPLGKSFHSTADQIANVAISESGPVRASVNISGSINGESFVQTITLTEGSPIIDFNLQIDWTHSPEIGKNPSDDKQAFVSERSFYNDKFKLHLTFPSIFDGGDLYKDAPFDVCKSELDNTFYDTWETIKHNVILNWVDLEKNGSGLSIFSDHTTSYLYGKESYPLGLTVQFIGTGLWGRNYTVNGPTDIHYALMPHHGGWDESDLTAENQSWNEPLISGWGENRKASESLLPLDGTGYMMAASYFKGNDLYVRLFNETGDDSEKTIEVYMKYDKATMVELNGEEKEKLGGGQQISIKMPRFGLRTIKFTNARLHE